MEKENWDDLKNTKAIYNPWSECEFCSFSSNLNNHFSSFTGASNARNDGMSVISVNYSMCLVYNVSDLRTFDFSYAKAITHGQSANFVHFLATGIFVFLHSQEHPMQGMTV